MEEEYINLTQNDMGLLLVLVKKEMEVNSSEEIKALYNKLLDIAML